MKYFHLVLFITTLLFSAMGLTMDTQPFNFQTSEEDRSFDEYQKKSNATFKEFQEFFPERFSRTTNIQNQNAKLSKETQTLELSNKIATKKNSQQKENIESHNSVKKKKKRSKKKIQQPIPVVIAQPVVEHPKKQIVPIIAFNIYSDNKYAAHAIGSETVNAKYILAEAQKRIGNLDQSSNTVCISYSHHPALVDPKKGTFAIFTAFEENAPLNPTINRYTRDLMDNIGSFCWQKTNSINYPCPHFSNPNIKRSNITL